MPEECHRARAERCGWRRSRRGGSISRERMLVSSICRAAGGLLSLCCVAGCGATGLDWVAEAHLESAQQQQRVSAVTPPTSRRAMSDSIPATAEPSSPDARPRLSRTVTLGEIDVVATRTAPPAASGPSVIVNNYNQVNVVTPSFGYGNAYALGTGRFSPAHVTPHGAQTGASSPLPGQSWPAVADHGPRFPYQASPASPWTRTQ